VEFKPLTLRYWCFYSHFLQIELTGLLEIAFDENLVLQYKYNYVYCVILNCSKNITFFYSWWPLRDATSLTWISGITTAASVDLGSDKGHRGQGRVMWVWTYSVSYCHRQCFVCRQYKVWITQDISIQEYDGMNEKNVKDFQKMSDT